MLKTIEDISATKKRLNIEVSYESIENEIKTTLDVFRRKANIPGFRPGKAPASLIEKRFGKDAEAEALEKIVPKAYGDALKQAEITPVSQPVLEGGLNYMPHSPLSLTIVVEIMPKIENLKYDGIKVKDIPVELKDSEIEGTLKRLQEQRASYEPYDGPVKNGDLVLIDSFIKEEGKSSEETFKVDSDNIPKEFYDNIMGKKKAESAEFAFTFPSESPDKERAGKTFNFKVTVKDIKNPVLPNMDDEFAKDLEMDNLDALKAHIRERLEASQKDAIKKIQKADILKKLVEAYEFEIPQSHLESELHMMLADARAQGRQESEEALKEELKLNAMKRAKATLLIKMIGDREAVKVSDDELKTSIIVQANRMRLDPENLIKYYMARDGSFEGLRHSIFEEKVLDILHERAELEKEGAAA